MQKKILFVCGSLNQTSMMHKIAQQLPWFQCYFTPFFCDGIYKLFQSRGLLDFTIIGGQNRESTERYLSEHQLLIDYAGESHEYDLFVTCTDLLVQKKLHGKPVVLVQEGMTDPENLAYQVVRRLRHIGVPLWLASTSTTGLSDAYTYFCVASEGYRKHFERKGVDPKKIVVTGIPNFDNVVQYADNDFPHRKYVLVATSDTRENFKFDRRRKFIETAAYIANGRQLIVKFHPNEDPVRGESEVKSIVPNALVFSKGNTAHMVANCDVLITQYSSVAFWGLALGKEVYSYFDMKELSELVPQQNGGTSAVNIAAICKKVLGGHIDQSVNYYSSSIRLQSAAQ